MTANDMVSMAVIKKVLQILYNEYINIQTDVGTAVSLVDIKELDKLTGALSAKVDRMTEDLKGDKL